MMTKRLFFFMSFFILLKSFGMPSPLLGFEGEETENDRAALQKDFFGEEKDLEYKKRLAFHHTLEYFFHRARPHGQGNEKAQEAQNKLKTLEVSKEDQQEFTRAKEKIFSTVLISSQYHNLWAKKVQSSSFFLEDELKKELGSLKIESKPYPAFNISLSLTSFPEELKCLIYKFLTPLEYLTLREVNKEFYASIMQSYPYAHYGVLLEEKSSEKEFKASLFSQQIRLAFKVAQDLGLLPFPENIQWPEIVPFVDAYTCKFVDLRIGAVWKERRPLETVFYSMGNYLKFTKRTGLFSKERIEEKKQALQKEKKFFNSIGELYLSFLEKNLISTQDKKINLKFLLYKKDIQKAFQEFLKSKNYKEDHPEVQYLHFKYDVSLSPNTKLEYLKKAAEQGYAKAQYGLGMVYAGGVNIEEDYEKARALFERSAAQNYARAQSSLAFCYMEGKGVIQDYTKAAYWFKQAVNQGESIAQHHLGALYEQGLGVKLDYRKACLLYQKAAEQNLLIAQYTLGVLYMSSQLGHPDYVKAKYWLEKAAFQEHPIAQYTLVMFYEEGLGGKQDQIKARQWAKRAAKNNVSLAQHHLASLYEKGQGGRQSYIKARRWYEKAASQGCAFSQFSLGSLYERGDAGLPNYRKAKEWWEKAAAQNYSIACYSLALLYKGNYFGIPQNLEMARSYYEKAARLGYEPAAYSGLKLPLIPLQSCC